MPDRVSYPQGQPGQTLDRGTYSGADQGPAEVTPEADGARFGGRCAFTRGSVEPRHGSWVQLFGSATTATFSPQKAQTITSPGLWSWVGSQLPGQSRGARAMEVASVTRHSDPARRAEHHQRTHARRVARGISAPFVHFLGSTVVVYVQ